MMSYALSHQLTDLYSLQQRGVAGYFDGATLRMSRKVLSSAIGWAVYEGLLMFIRTSQLKD